MKHYQCENCGAELVQQGDKYVCEYCKRTYADDSLEKAYEKVRLTIQSTVKEVVSAEFLNAKIEKIASCRQGLYKARTGEYIDNDDINFWSKQILKLLPDDAQANFYEIASAERWSELNKFLSKFNVKENAYLLDGFVDFLTNGRVVEKCVLRLDDLIAKAFKETSDEYKACHKKIVDAAEKQESGIFDPTLPRDVFVAYSSKDSEKAYEMVEFLEERGLKCFISMRNLPKGVNAERYYEERLEQAIDNCQVFLFVSSKNSRSRNCDAYTKEIKHVKDLDLQRYSVDERNYWNTHYDEFDKRNGKPRVEFIVEEYGNSIYETEVAKFFRGLSWCTDKASVLDVVTGYVTGNPIEEKRAQADEIAKQKEEFARKQAEFERQKAEFERLKAERERQKADELARQQAEIQRQKAEFEKQRAELERQKEELKKSAENKPKAEETKVEEPSKTEKEIPQLRRNRAPISGLKETLKNPSKMTENLEKLSPAPAAPVEKPEFEIKNGVLIKYNGVGGDVIIPDGVTEIGFKAFSHSKVTSVIIPFGVTKINNNAFEVCQQLVSVKIPNSITYIGASAFFYCSTLNSIIIPESVVDWIGGSAFNGCSQLTIYAEAKEKPSGWHNDWNPDNRSVEWGYVKIPKFTEKGCDYSIKSPEQAKKMFEIELAEMKRRQAEEKAKQQSQPTQSAPVPATEIRYTERCAESGISDAHARIQRLKEMSAQSQAATNNSSQKEIPPLRKVKPSSRGVELALNPLINKADFEIENGVLKKYKGQGGDVVIPDGVTKIGMQAFKFSKISSIILPNSVTEIDFGAFSGCDKLVSVKMKNVKSISAQVFDACSNLRNIELPESVAVIGARAFSGCNSLTAIEIPSKVKEIYDSTFNCCGRLTSVKIHSNVTKIGEGAFSMCVSLKEIKLPNTIEVIGNKAFYHCTQLTIYAEAEKKPKGWVHSLFGKENWNPDNRPVKWGYKG